MKVKLQYLFYSAFLIITGATMFTSCSDEVSSSETENDAKTAISFNVSVDNDWQGNTTAKAPMLSFSISPEGNGQDLRLTGTVEHGINAQQTVKATDSRITVINRAMMVSSANFYDNFYLYGFGDNDRLSVTKGENGKYSANGHPSEVASAVTAIAPQYEQTFTQSKLSVALDGNTLNQKDIMVTTDNVEAGSSNLNLSFRHILAAVNFKVGKMGFADDVRINSIAIQGIYTKGSYDVAQDSWSLDGTGNESVDLSTSISSTNASSQENVMLTSGNAGNAFMMIPQTTPSDAKIIVSLTYDNEDHTLSFPFGNRVLTQGYTVTLGIGSSDNNYGGYVLSVTNPASIYPYEDNQTQDFIVTSYRNDKDKTPVGWTVESYSEDGGLTWSTDFPKDMSLAATTGQGGQEGNSVGATLSIPTEDNLTWMKRTLRAAKEVSDYDLSLHDINGKAILRSTANTYVVRAGGTYLIPLVIGNTIKNGATHIFNGKWANTFVDWKNRQVTTGNYKITEATGARLVWSDAGDDIISDLSIIDGADGLKYLRFKVSKDNIAPGNALLAVTAKDGGNEVAIWSWQIWFTAADLSYTIPVKGFTQHKRTYQFPPLPLGSKGNTRRRILLRVRQKESGKTAIVTLNQMPSPSLYDGAYYQW